jgi:midasin (ATPase involved in ribosome maturation)
MHCITKDILYDEVSLHVQFAMYISLFISRTHRQSIQTTNGTICREHCQSYIVTEANLKCIDDISEYLKSNSNSPFVISGESGSGKTSMLAYLNREGREEREVKEGKQLKIN